MKIQEYLAKGILSAYGINIPSSRYYPSFLEGEPPFLPCVLKSQVLVGSRMKNGGVLFAENRSDFFFKLHELMKKPINGTSPEGVLVEEKVDTLKEYYCCIFLNRQLRDVCVSFSEKGGIDVEAHPDSLITGKYEEMLRIFTGSRLLGITKVVRNMRTIMEEKDATYIEINPLALTTRDKLVALDCVMDLDENASFRHDDFDALMKLPDSKCTFHYVKLDGDIGIIGCGAGIVMATMDAIQMRGGRPADFLDIGGGAEKETTYDALKTLFDNGIRTIVLNVFGGITSCSDIADAVIDFINEHHNAVLYIRIDGNDAIVAKEKLSQCGIPSFEHMYEMVEACIQGVSVEC